MQCPAECGASMVFDKQLSMEERCPPRCNFRAYSIMVVSRKIMSLKENRFFEDSRFVHKINIFCTNRNARFFIVGLYVLHIHFKGYTADLTNRLNDHNNHRVKATKAWCPWEIFRTAGDAVRREKQLKSWKSRKSLERLQLHKNKTHQ
jgi:predicted GIY-YIG superfamily endonuclease